MAATFVVEDGTPVANSNSYCTVDEADIYHENRLHASVWTTTGEDDKETALVWAARLLDEQVIWDGYKYDEDNSMHWPRGGAYDQAGYAIETDEIPQFLKDAVSEFARVLISSDRTLEDDTKGFNYLRVGTLEARISKNDRVGIIPRSVWSIIKFGCTKRGSRTRMLLRA